MVTVILPKKSTITYLEPNENIRFQWKYITMFQEPNDDYNLTQKKVQQVPNNDSISID